MLDMSQQIDILNNLDRAAENIHDAIEVYGTGQSSILDMALHYIAVAESIITDAGKSKELAKEWWQL